MRPLQRSATSARQRVFGVGPEPGLLDDLEPLFSESSIEARRVAFGALALEQIRHALPDLLIVEHPMADMATDRFVRKVRDAVNAPLTILLLAETARRGELSSLEESGEIVLPADGPPESLVEAAKRFLRKDRRCARSIMVRLGVTLGDSQLLRLAQTVNVSQRGMLVRTSEHFSLGSDVRFEILLPEDEQPIRGVARAVRYADPEKEAISGVGLEFVEMENDGSGRLSAFLQANPG